MSTIDAIKELRADFARRGWFEKATGRILMELIIHGVLAVSGVVMFLAFQHPALKVLGILISIYGTMGVGTNTHTSSHYATSDRRWVNEALSYFGYPFFVGLSATYWWHKHVTLHHPSPNVIGVDTDADLLPWFTMTMDEVHTTSGFRRFYHQHVQFWIFPFALAINCFSIQAGGWIHLARMLSDPKKRKSAHWIDLGALVLHYALWIGVPLLFFPFSTVLVLYLLRTVLLGYAMYAILAPGHFPAEAQRITEEAREDTDFFTLQTEATVSFRTGWLGRFVCSGLEYQVEHHLFPNISHIHYPKVSVAVREFCERHGLRYRSDTWGMALWKSWMVLRAPRWVVGQVVEAEPAPELVAANERG